MRKYEKSIPLPSLENPEREVLDELLSKLGNARPAREYQTDIRNSI